MPVFPTTPIKDNFNRADEGGPPSSSWIDVSGWLVNTNQFVPQTAAGGDFSIYDAVYGPDCEAYLTVPVLPTQVDNLYLHIRFSPSAYTGYFLSLSFDPAGADTLRIWRRDGIGGGDNPIGALVGGLAFAAGDSIGIRVIGNTITSYYKIGAGAWVLQDTFVDATYGASGYTGVEDVSTDEFTADNYGAGTIIGGAFPQAGVVDTFTRADESASPSSGWKDVSSVRVVSSEAGGFSAIGGVSLWNNSSIGPDCEVYAAVGAVPTDGNVIDLFARLDLTALTGYSLAWTYNLAGADDIAVINLTGGPLANQAQDLAPGDKFGMQLIGDTIYVYIDVGAGWTLLFATVDPAPALGAGYIGALFADYIGRLDDFGGGDYAAPGAGAAGVASGSGALIHSLDSHVFVQFGDGQETFYLGDCTVVPSLPSPSPDRRPVFSSIGARGYEQIGFEPGSPGAPTLAITTFVAGAAHYLEQVKEADCPFNLYILAARCAANQAFNNYERAWVYRNCEFTDDPIENAVLTEDDKLMEHVFNVIAWNGRVDHRPITITRQEVSQTGDALGLAVFPPRCASDCEEAVAACQEIVIGAGSVAAAIPDFYYTLDGITWLTQASGFVATTDVRAVGTFQNFDGDYAIAAMRDNLAGNALRCEVGVIGSSAIATVGATPNDGAIKDSCLFVLDARHIWVCTTTGRVYFSSDGAQTWVEQASALVASGGDDLRAIRFADALVGYCVGSNDTILSTTDGGETWTDNPSGLGEDWLSLWVFSHQRLAIGAYSIFGSGGNLFMSYDAGTTWVDLSRWPVVTGVTVVWDIDFLPDGLTGYLILRIVGSPARVYKSIDGGYNWRRLEMPDNTDLQSIQICQPNLGIVVGDAHGGTSFIARISG
jgi:hypothetical protein